MVAFYRQSVYFIGNGVLSYLKSPVLTTEYYLHGELTRKKRGAVSFRGFMVALQHGADQEQHGEPSGSFICLTHFTAAH